MTRALAVEMSGVTKRFTRVVANQSASLSAYAGEVHAYLNRCAHVAMELDWQEGVFFDAAGRDLLCSTHGATYDTRSGRCVGGPCNRSPLVKLHVEERDGMIYFMGFPDD